MDDTNPGPPGFRPIGPGTEFPAVMEDFRLIRNTAVRRHVVFSDDWKGVARLEPGRATTRIGAHGTPIFFLHPKDMMGQLTEIMETPKDDAHWSN